MSAWNRALKSGAVVLVAVLGAARPVCAQDPLHKAGRGVANVLTGWVEVPKQVYNGLREDNPFTGVVGGLAKGIGLTVVRVAVAAYEIATFPLPMPRGYQSPYANLELPDYAWE